jgi:Ca2+/Na+ antiporter
MLDVLILMGGIATIILGANWLVDGASSAARRFAVSNLIIGLTVVAFGTSAPELAVNIISALRGSTDLAIGNILGSNISNILLILGVSSLVYPLQIPRNTKWIEIPFSLIAAYKKNTGIAVGNIVGSNIFNIFLVLGLTSTIKPIPFNTSINSDIGLTIIASFLLFLTTVIVGMNRVVRLEGAVFLLIYLIYITSLVL